MTDYHSRFLTLVDEIEATFPVAHWQAGNVPVWPLARTRLYSNLYQQIYGTRKRPQPWWRPRPVAKVEQAAAYAATPLINLWRSRNERKNLLLFPHRARALFLGDGESLDLIHGAWHDRFCEPLISQLEGDGQSTLLMQRGELSRLPWAQPTFPANTIIRWARLAAPAFGWFRRAPHFPDHDLVLKFLNRESVPTHGLDMDTLHRQAAVVAATAHGFEHVLQIVRPSFCFMVAYYTRMGHAFALACRRRGILSVDLQREGRGAQHEAYHWSGVPESGYAILPAVFWNWTEEDATAIERWSRKLAAPWHSSLLGGHPQLACWFNDQDPQTRTADGTIGKIRARAQADLEILVALQTLDGFDEVWNDLAALIEAAPPRWRWWLRRHPNTLHLGDRGLGRLLAIRRPNVLIEEASSVPLPGLLRHMDVLLSLRSGAAAEASLFGVKSVFLSAAAREMFRHLLDAGKAEIIDDMALLEQRLALLPRGPKVQRSQPKLSDVFSRLHRMAAEYSAMCGKI